MKNKINIITIIILILIITIIFIYINKKEYTYICLNKTLIKDEYVLEDNLKECVTKNKLPKDTIINKYELIDKREGYNYILIKDKYEPNEILSKDDFKLIMTKKISVTDIALLKEVEVLDHGSSSEDFTRYKAYIKDGKLYAINLNNNQEKMIFDKEEIKNIAIRPYCCAGNSKLIILTTNGNVYLSKQDCTYSFNFNIEFIKLEISDIKAFKLIPNKEDDIVKSLYGINSKNIEILINEPDW